MNSIAPAQATTEKSPVCQPRGPLSQALLARLTGADNVSALSLVDEASHALSTSRSVTHDEDLQLSLFLLYASSYGSLSGFSAELEWDPAIITARAMLERAFEAELRKRVEVPALPPAEAPLVAKALFELTEADGKPSTALYFAKQANREQAVEFLVQRSIYTLREADPHSWAIPRLTGRPKAALVEIQSDEYGGGQAHRVHATMFANSMRGAGLDSSYGTYIDLAPAVTLASHNTMSMFGINRRLLGAVVGHLAAFEMTSSIPNKFYADGFRRLGFGEDVTAYFDEHVEADAVHEQIAAHDLAGALAEERPELLADIFFGAAACLQVDGEMSEHLRAAWSAGKSSLRQEVNS